MKLNLKIKTEIKNTLNKIKFNIYPDQAAAATTILIFPKSTK